MPAVCLALPHATMKLVQLSALVFALALWPHHGVGATPGVEQLGPATNTILLELQKGVLARTREAPQSWSETGILEVLKSSHLTAEHSAAVWAFMADEDNAPIWTPALVAALITASDTPKAREAMWGELAGSAAEFGRRRRMREHSLAGFFERNRPILRSFLFGAHDTEPSCDAIIQLMLSSQFFGAGLEESVAFVSERIPASVARFIENQRGLGRRVDWETTAYKSMLKWKNARFLPGAALQPRSLAELRDDGRTLMGVFNSLQGFDAGIREGVLRGLDPGNLFNAVIAGEQELYRVGTSGYQSVLHAALLRNIEEAGSLEDFLDRVLPRRFGNEAVRTARDRRMAFLRIASHFGLLQPVLETVRDRDRFTDELIAALAVTHSFTGNSPVVLDMLAPRLNTPQAAALKAALLDRLYSNYRVETGVARRNAYGCLLSVYQTISGDHRDTSIDRDFALDGAAFNIPFARLFSRDETGDLVHRMFMRMDSDDDAVETYATFRAMMSSLHAAVREQSAFDVFVIGDAGRRIEIYANKPDPAGVKRGILDLASALKDRRVETVIGRGHTAIIEPLQDDAKRVLGSRIKDVTSIIVGSCGGDAAVLDLIATFGYKPFITTRSTGRHVINHAVIRSYVGALMALPPGDHLAVADVLKAATARFMRDGADEDLRADAGLYQVNMATVFTAQLYDAYLRRYQEPDQRAALE